VGVGGREHGSGICIATACSLSDSEFLQPVVMMAVFSVSESSINPSPFWIAASFSTSGVPADANNVWQRLMLTPIKASA
jgi:hypothetical protein